MADWTDGPEYAPHERPSAFVVPPLPPLATPPPAVPVPPAPDAEPSFAAPQAVQPDLAALVPAGAPGRNPNVAFEVSSAAITSGAWAPPTGTPLRAPTQPFTEPGPPITGYLPAQPTVQAGAQVNPATFPAPNTPQWFAPPPDSRVPAAPPPVTVAQIWRAATPGVMIPLVIGMLFSWLSIMMLLISFVLSARIAYRRMAVRRAYSVAMALIVLNGVLSVLTDGYSSTGLFSVLSGWAELACVVLLFVIALIVGAALRAGERPDRTD